MQRWNPQHQLFLLVSHETAKTTASLSTKWVCIESWLKHTYMGAFNPALDVCPSFYLHELFSRSAIAFQRTLDVRTYRSRITAALDVLIDGARDLLSHPVTEHKLWICKYHNVTSYKNNRWSLACFHSPPLISTTSTALFFTYSGLGVMDQILLF
jgi:hypothetical protein